jgi:hypothetical protein
MTALEGRVPENALLSHDLFEGVHARAALVTDVEVVDDYPSNVLTHARRQHRWVRGDWQILWWLFPWVPTRGGLERNPLRLIARWKILDNLRRSLVAPSVVALFIAGWSFLPGRPIGWTLAAMATMSFAATARALSLFAGPRKGLGWRVFLRGWAEDFGTDLARVAIHLTFLAHQAWDMLDAVAVTLARLITRKGPLPAVGDRRRGRGPRQASGPQRLLRGDAREPDHFGHRAAGDRDRQAPGPAGGRGDRPALGDRAAHRLSAQQARALVAARNHQRRSRVPQDRRARDVALLRDLRRRRRSLAATPTTCSSIPSRASRIARRRPTSR